jgi:uncharacterized protein YgbK (DUF1537 family)
MTLRLLADDLTGALDSAVQFLARFDPVTLYLAGTPPPGAAAAFDSVTRELPPAEAFARTAAAARLIADGAPAYCKLDSLLRGSPAAAIVACLQAGFAHGVIAPAYPAQGRATRAGRQFVRLAGSAGFVPTGPDLAADLAARGVAVTRCRPGDAAPSGVSLWDAETDADLAQVAAAGARLPGRVLWCGSAGLAAALAGDRPPPAAPPDLPLLALVGSHHPVTLAQLEAAAPWHVRLDPDALDRQAADRQAAQVARHLAADGFAAVTVALPQGVAEDVAAGRIQACFHTLLATIPRPACLFVTGGETLRGLCTALGVQALSVQGEVAPGVPSSILRGGDWDGLRVISKSGAFGAAHLLVSLRARD